MIIHMQHAAGYLQQELANEQDGMSPDQGMGILEACGHSSHVTVNHRGVPVGV